MHFCQEILVKANSIEEAREKTKEFLEDYSGGEVWDWYVFGGRWMGHHLTEKEREKFMKQKRFWEKCRWCNGTGDRKDMKDEVWKKKVNGCNSCNGTGKTMKFTNGDEDVDVMKIKGNVEMAKKVIDRQLVYIADDLKGAKESLDESLKRNNYYTIDSFIEDLVSKNGIGKNIKMWDIGWNIKKIIQGYMHDGYRAESYFYDIEIGSSLMDDVRWEEVKRNGENYYLLTVDLHN